jgi:hypothetical protein
LETESQDRDPDRGAGPPRKVQEYERWFRFLDGQNRVLERERQKLSAVLNHTDAGFLVLDGTRSVVWANEVFRKSFDGLIPARSSAPRATACLCGT